jgi:hypothetical protein
MVKAKRIKATAVRKGLVSANSRWQKLIQRRCHAKIIETPAARRGLGCGAKAWAPGGG